MSSSARDVMHGLARDACAVHSKETDPGSGVSIAVRGTHADASGVARQIGPSTRGRRRSARQRIHDAWREARLRLREADRADARVWGSVRRSGMSVELDPSAMRSADDVDRHAAAGRSPEADGWSVARGGEDVVDGWLGGAPRRMPGQDMGGTASIVGQADGDRSFPDALGRMGAVDRIEVARAEIRRAESLHARHGPARETSIAPPVPVDDGRIDAFLGGGLRRDALHAVCGTWLDPMSPIAASPRKAASISMPGTGPWVVPFGVLRRLVVAAIRGEGGGRHAVAWIGSGVHPALRSSVLPAAASRRPAASPPACDASCIPSDMSRAGGSAADDTYFGRPGIVATDDLADDALLGACSVFVHDMAPKRTERMERTGMERAEPGRRRAFVVDSIGGPDPVHGGAGAAIREDGARDRAAWRAWCTEEAIRAEAFAAVVVDATRVDALAWRRLQLAVRSVERPPLVLLVQPPCEASAGRAPSDGGSRFAETRWDVLPACPQEAHAGAAIERRVGPESPGGVSRAWWMVLRAAKRSMGREGWSARSTDAEGVSPNGIGRSALEAGAWRVLVQAPRILERAECTEAWEGLRGRDVIGDLLGEAIGEAVAVQVEAEADTAGRASSPWSARAKSADSPSCRAHHVEQAMPAWEQVA